MRRKHRAGDSKEINLLSAHGFAMTTFLKVFLIVSVFIPANLRASQFGSHGITLTWATSATPNATMYKVYRGTVSGGPYTLVGIEFNMPGTATMSWQDGDMRMVDGTKYYYVVTAALPATNHESALSNEVSTVYP